MEVQKGCDIWLRDALAAQGINPFHDGDQLRELAVQAVERFHGVLPPDELEIRVGTIISEVVGFGPLQQFLDDPHVEEIWINGPSRIFVARDGVPELTTTILSDQQVHDLVERMLLFSGRRLDLSSPFVDAMLSSGERLHVVIPPVTGSSWCVNIRKHVQRARSLMDLVQVGMINEAAATFLLASLDAGLSIVVSGATQAGKTTLLRALANQIPRKKRVISCEEVFELNLHNRDGVALQTRPANMERHGELTLRDLVRETLRMRPEYIVVGEVRGPEALDLILALNAGVPGMATVHANSARDALSRLIMLPLLAGENVTQTFIVPAVAKCVDLVCHVQRDREGNRFVSEIIAVNGRIEDNTIETSQIWVYDGGSLVRGTGGIDSHDSFALAGYDLSTLLRGDA